MSAALYVTQKTKPARRSTDVGALFCEAVSDFSGTVHPYNVLQAGVALSMADQRAQHNAPVRSAGCAPARRLAGSLGPRPLSRIIYSIAMDHAGCIYPPWFVTDCVDCRLRYCEERILTVSDWLVGEPPRGRCEQYYDLAGVRGRKLTGCCKLASTIGLLLELRAVLPSRPVEGSECIY